MKKLVLFDIDGTILTSAGAGRRAIIAALATELDHSHAWEQVRFDGKTDPQILRELFAAAGHSEPPTPERIDALGERYVALLESELALAHHRTTVLPGVPQLLDAVESEPHVVMGLLTGNFVRGAALKLRSAGIEPNRFKVGAYGSDSAHRAELPPIAAERARPFFGRVPTGDEIVIVGDTPSDVTCGAGIGARAIGVATGSYSLDQLREAGAAAVFPTLAATRDVLEAILG
jgi:phosphoglycolate phosphatase-like HAD superfamily hydrolase